MCPELFRIGDFVISTYGVFVAVGMVIAFYIFLYFVKKENIDEKKAENIFLFTIVGGLIGARIAYIIEHPDQFKTLVDYVAIWKGGIDWFGGFLGGVFTALLLIRYYKVNIWKISDAAAVALILGHGIGRIGCTFAGCCYGKPIPEHSFWEHFGITFPEGSAAPPGMKLYPTQPLEAFLNIFLFFILFLAYRKKFFDGQIFSMYLILYGTERFFLEFLRNVTPPIEPVGLTWNQIVSILMVIFGISLIVYRLKYQKVLKLNE